MEKKVYSTSGKELRTITLDDKVFGLPVNDDVIYYAITNELANKRVGTACTDRSFCALQEIKGFFISR